VKGDAVLFVGDDWAKISRQQVCDVFGDYDDRDCEAALVVGDRE
jgi:hypothetical protein